ncbi:hypothetical protein AGMMS49942_05650 [Spirochaetia bacterium]|nr:hypothetical protein AGMMS49942_05650 [Spirochaetia bacterium]
MGVPIPRVLKKLTGFLMMTGITVALCAQTSPPESVETDSGASQFINVKVWVAPTRGGSAEDRAYFDFNLPEEVKGSGYDLTNSLYPTPEEAREASDFYIICRLEYDAEYDDNVITAELYSTRTDAVIITTSMGYQTTEEMNDWNLTMIYRLMANAPISKSLDMEEFEYTGKGGEPKVYPQYRLFLGLRGGYSLRIYTPSIVTIDPVDPESTFEAALHVAYHPWRYLGFQTEVVFTRDSTSFQSYDQIGDKHTYQYNSMSLMIPLLVKGTFAFSQFVVSPLAGVYLTFPLGRMTMINETNKKIDEETADFSYPLPLGLTAGVEMGMHLGPGLLFLDIRYAADLAKTVRLSEDATTDLYHRNMVSLSLGYKFGLLRKNPAAPR